MPSLLPIGPTDLRRGRRPGCCCSIGGGWESGRENTGPPGLPGHCCRPVVCDTAIERARPSAPRPQGPLPAVSPTPSLTPAHSTQYRDSEMPLLLPSPDARMLCFMNEQVFERANRVDIQCSCRDQHEGCRGRGFPGSLSRCPGRWPGLPSPASATVAILLTKMDSNLSCYR